MLEQLLLVRHYWQVRPRSHRSQKTKSRHSRTSPQKK